MANLEKYLIIVRGEDKTGSVLSWKHDQVKPVIYIRYHNSNKSYPYAERDVDILECPETMNTEGKIVLKNNTVVFGVNRVQYFDDYCRLFYLNGYHQLEKIRDIKIIESALDIPKAKNCMDYLKELAIQVGLMVGDHNILAQHYESMDYVREDCVLADYLCGEYKNDKIHDKKAIVYPFGFNLSQKKAVENAIYNRISVIEGPPGTGKTQTILNIIANAVMRNQSVAVVSSNNSATMNVYEKLQKYGVDFIAANLGNSDNKQLFVENQKNDVPNLDEWNDKTVDSIKMKKEESELNKLLALQNLMSEVETEHSVIMKEYEFFCDYYGSLSIAAKMPRMLFKVKSNKILEFLAEFEKKCENGKGYSGAEKMVLWFRFGILNFSFLKSPSEHVMAFCQNMYYKSRIKELLRSKEKLQKELRDVDFSVKMKSYTDDSIIMFKSHIAKKYKNKQNRKIYEIDDLWKHSDSFIDDYPVVLSTTYSLRSSLSKSYVYDYVIVDEASQVNLATGALALSCAKKVVVVGDLKQLPNVVNAETEKITDDLFKQYDISEAYRYSENSLLSSVVSLFPRAPRVLLKEHYRCHPEIIGFCNQKFYNNELIVLSKPKSDKKPLMVYRTVQGNHARERYNQRQIDVILKEVFPQQKLSKDDGTVGVVTPYKNQALALQAAFEGTTVKADTADKFQGQERSVIIFSTVDNEIGDFASDPNRLNVAVSRAVDQFIVVTDGNNNDQTSSIHELIGYIQYHNHEVVDSEVRSVFDYLYSQYADARSSFLKKHGAISDVESENLMYQIIKDVLDTDEFSALGVASHIQLRMILNDYSKLNQREFEFAMNVLTHVDFLLFSKLTHQPVLVIEVDGYAFHDNNDKQLERDIVKNSILNKYSIPLLRLSTIGSGEQEKLEQCLRNIFS